MATQTNTLRFELDVKARMDKVDGFVSGPMIAQFKHFLTLAAGTGQGQVDNIYHKTLQIAGAASSTIDLDGSLANILGAVADFVKVKFIGISNVSNKQSTVTDADILILGDFMTTNFGASFSMKLNTPGVFCWYDEIGHTVVATTGDDITITNNDASDQAEVNVLIAGTST